MPALSRAKPSDSLMLLKPTQGVPHEGGFLFDEESRPYKIIEHRNTQHELVQTERVPSEHLTRIVADEKELAKALKEGWVKEPYIAAALPDPNASLYESK